MAVWESLPYKINIDLNIYRCQGISLTRSSGAVRMPPEVHDETSGQGGKTEKDLWVELESAVDAGDPAPRCGKIYYDVINVNYVPMDSILVKYTYTSSSNQSTVSYEKLRPLSVGDKISDVAEFTIGTGNLTDVRIIIEINPDKDQIELYTFNNVLSKQFDVAKDDDNPLLDIYFDGVRIMDGDIVSPKPEILVTLSDENNLLPIADPTLFEVKLDTGRNQIIEIPISSPQIKFIPASGNSNTAKLMYYPTLKEGDYTLYVQGRERPDQR